MFCIIPCRCLSSSNMVAKLGPSPAVFSSILPLINGLGDRTRQSKNCHWRAPATRTATATATATKTSLKKWICATSNYVALIPSRLILRMLANFFEADSKGLHQSSAKEKESCCLVFQSSTNREIRHFHVLVVQWRQRNEQKSLMHVQTCCFVNLNLLFFCRSRWPRRSRCLSSLMIDRNPSACSCPWILRLS